MNTKAPGSGVRMFAAALAAGVALGVVAGFGAGRASAQDAASGKDWNAAVFRKPSDSELRQRLDPLQYRVTQQAGTEPAFANQYWNNHQAGIYVDVVSGEPLFSSLDKYDSGTGWPSFTRPLEPENVKLQGEYWPGNPFGTEVRSAHANSHLGHVFGDGPPPDHKRYCMNSAAMRFIPADKLAAAGYGKYVSLFSKKPAGG